MNGTNDPVLLGIWRYLVPVPAFIWRKEASGEKQEGAGHLAFFSPDHHRVRDFAVRELPRAGQPIPPEVFARELDLPLQRVDAILGQLEKHLTFLFRNPQGAVTWAYPVTVEPTPHRVTFSSGEKLYAA
jgi:hypothetical protein